METRQVIWLSPASKSRFKKKHSELKYKREEITVDYLVRQDTLLKKLDPELHKKIKFTLS